MKTIILAVTLAGGTALAAESGTNSVVDRLLAQSGRIRTLRAEIRREVEAGGQSVQTLSRVWFERPDRLRVETVTPHARRIVADGTAIHKWIEGQDFGVRIPIAEAGEGELMQLRKTPGTADEHLMRIRPYPETPLPPADGFASRWAYTPPDPHPYTVLSLDATGRLARLEFFDPTNRTRRLLNMNFTGWQEAKPGIWISTIQKTEAAARDGKEVSETLRVSRLEVNEPQDPVHFKPEAQAGKIRFLSVAEAEEKLK